MERGLINKICQDCFLNIFSVLLLIISMSLPVGCAISSGDGEDSDDYNNTSDDDDDSDDNVKIADNVILVDDDVAVSLYDNTLVFSSDEFEALGDVDDGDILVSGEGDGYIVRVVDIDDDGTNVTVATEQATLAEAIENGSLNEVVPLTFSEDGPYRLYSQDGLSAELNYDNHELYNQDGLRVKLTQANISFEPDLELDLEIENHALDYFRAEVVGTVSGAIAIEATYTGANFSLSHNATLYQSPSHYSTFMIGWVPVVLKTTLYLEAGFDVGFDQTMTAEAGASLTSTASFGAEYSNGSWSIIADNDFDFTAIGPTFEATSTLGVRGYLRPKIEAKFYSVAGPTISVEPYGEINIDFMPPPSWELIAGIKGNIGAKFTVLDVILIEYSQTLFDLEWSLDSDYIEASDCTDPDGDGYGTGTDCLGTDCSETDDSCWSGTCCDEPVDCADSDGDGYGVGTDCLGTDCDDSNNSCWSGVCCDPSGDCTDNDGDGYGVGADCLGTDCNDSNDSVWFGCATLYVDVNDGNCTYIQAGNQIAPNCSIAAALDFATAGDNIYVAEGEYGQLNIDSDTNLVGGFNSADWSRDPDVYATVIQSNSDSSPGMIVQNGTTVNADGFTIRGKNPSDYYSSPSRAITNDGTLTIVDSSVSGGSSYNYCANGINNTGTLTILSSNVTAGNSWYDYCDAINNSGDVILKNNFIRNFPEYGGRVIYNSGNLTAVNNMILMSSNAYSYAIESSGALKLINNSISSCNYTECYVLYITGGSLTAVNNTISGGDSESGYIYYYDIMSSIYTRSSSVTLLRNNIWGNGIINDVDYINSCNWSGCILSDGNISADPKYVSSIDFHLQSVSPCIDAGLNPSSYLSDSSIYEDYDGDTRPNGTHWDIGMDEYVP